LLYFVQVVRCLCAFSRRSRWLKKRHSESLVAALTWAVRSRAGADTVGRWTRGRYQRYSFSSGSRSHGADRRLAVYETILAGELEVASPVDPVVPRRDRQTRPRVRSACEGDDDGDRLIAESSATMRCLQVGERRSGGLCGDWRDDAYRTARGRLPGHYRLAQVVGGTDLAGASAFEGDDDGDRLMAESSATHDAYRWAKTPEVGGQACGDWRDDAYRTLESAPRPLSTRWSATPDLAECAPPCRGDLMGQTRGSGATMRCLQVGEDAPRWGQACGDWRRRRLQDSSKSAPEPSRSLGVAGDTDRGALSVRGPVTLEGRLQVMATELQDDLSYPATRVSAVDWKCQVDRPGGALRVRGGDHAG
jgi:hypothetical protein